MIQWINILQSKLIIPQIKDTIHRKRLQQLSDQIPHKRLTTVTAGAGYGKSTFVAQAVQNRDVVWYRLNSSDKDFVTFLSYLIAGIQKFYPAFGEETFRRFEDPRVVNQEQIGVLTTFLHELETTLSQDLRSAENRLTLATSNQGAFALMSYDTNGQRALKWSHVGTGPTVFTTYIGDLYEKRTYTDSTPTRETIHLFANGQRIASATPKAGTKATAFNTANQWRSEVTMASLYDGGSVTGLANKTFHLLKAAVLHPHAARWFILALFGAFVAWILVQLASSLSFKDRRLRLYATPMRTVAASILLIFSFTVLSCGGPGIGAISQDQNYLLNGDTNKGPAIGTYYYHTNHINSSSVITDANGTEVTRIVYLPFGEISQANSTENDTVTYKFTGQEFDEDSGLYYYGSRYYDPAIGRFISADSVIPDIYNSQAFNRYSYVKNNPVMYTDPSGNVWCGDYYVEGQYCYPVIPPPPVVLPPAALPCPLATPPPVPPVASTPTAPAAVAATNAGAGAGAGAAVGVSSSAAFSLVSSAFSIAVSVLIMLAFKGGPLIGVSVGSFGGAGSEVYIPNPDPPGVYPERELFSSSSFSDTPFDTLKLDMNALGINRDTPLHIANWLDRNNASAWALGIGIGAGVAAVALVIAPEIAPAVAPMGAWITSQWNQLMRGATEGINTVYRSVTAGGQTQYVGITNNLARRAGEWLSSTGMQIEKVIGGLSRTDARAVEQALIDFHGLGKYGGTLLNKINSIAPTNPIYSEQLQRGYELLKSIGYR